MKEGAVGETLESTGDDGGQEGRAGRSGQLRYKESIQ